MIELHSVTRRIGQKICAEHNTTLEYILNDTSLTLHQNTMKASILKLDEMLKKELNKNE